MITDFEGTRASCSAITLLEDGKILATGSAQRDSSKLRDILLVKYNSNGSLDQDFGNKGKLITHFEEGSGASSMVVQKDGKILVAGTYSYYGVGIARFHKNGDLDSSFSDSGLVVNNIEGYYGEHYNSIALKSNGKIMAAGFAQESGNDSSHTLLARYLPDGRLDSSFGNNGIIVGSSGRTNAMFIQQDDKILLAGQVSKGTANDRFRFSVLRYNSDGSPDLNFGSNGKVYIPITNYGEAYALTVQDDGKILLAGYGNSPIHVPGSDFALVRLQSDGSLDKDFGTDGKITTVLEGPGKAHAVQVQENGKIIAAGYARSSSGGNHFALASYLPDGSLDASFGNKGIVISPTMKYSSGTSLAIQKDGKILLGGHTDTSGSNNTRIALLRFFGDEPLGKEETGYEQGLLHLYPNPTAGPVTIQVSPTFQNAQLSIYNSFGQLITAKDIRQQQMQLKCDNLADGIYIVVLTGQNGLTATHQLIIVE